MIYAVSAFSFVYRRYSFDRIFKDALVMDNPAIPPPPTPEQAAAMAATAHQFTVEVWTLLAVAALVTMLRTYARVRSVGFKRFQPDDYLVWVALVCFTLSAHALSRSLEATLRLICNFIWYNHRFSMPLRVVSLIRSETLRVAWPIMV
jgi:hypothetical protein